MKHHITSGFMITKNLNILIADDEPFMRNRLSKYLVHEYGSKITQASDGVAALKKHQCSGEKIDITFLDIDMPRMNGIEALMEIRMINPSAYIIIVSGVGTLANVKVAIDFGVNGFIVKPYNYDKISEALSNFASQVIRSPGGETNII